ncbi:MAG TPA: AAA family ATPase [Tepidisphaeraceae bacterium]
MPTEAPPQIVFGPFCLDRANARLLYDGKTISLTPKAFDVLHHLASRPDQLVTKNDLLDAIWPDVVVSDASIKVCVREIRQALADDIKSPKYIQTVHRRGYRFIASTPATATTTPAPTTPSPDQAPPPETTPAAPLVGRERELRKLHDALNRASHNHRQCVFITGPAGSGKTSLAQTFAQSAPTAFRAKRPIVLVGHCFEQFGTSEPYLPVWEALGRAARGSHLRDINSLLASQTAAHANLAPATALPSHTGAGDSDDPDDQPQASHRMLSDVADRLEAMACHAPVILILEDIHWADYSTLDLISALARRRTPAQLMIVASYRSDEVTAEDHPLRSIAQNLITSGSATVVPLEHFDEPQVEQYLSLRLGNHRLPRHFAQRLRQRTGGHPLFLVHLVSDLIEQGVIVECDGVWQLSADEDGAAGWLAVLETQVPSDVRQMIEAQLDRLTQDQQRVLEAASVAGTEFSAAAPAAAIAKDIVHVEQACNDLARRHHFLEAHGIDEWPDGTVATHYRFVHDLYHNVVYERLTVAHRARLHQTLGLRLEQAWGDRVAEEAASLSFHFEEGRDWPRAVVHLRQAAHAATRQYAHREALHYLRRAHTACQRLTEDQRAQHELPLLLALGVNLQVVHGCATPEVEAVYARAAALCKRSGESEATFFVLWGIWVFHKVRSDLVKAEELARRLLEMARASGNTALLLQAHQAMCVTALCLGNFALTVDHMTQAAAIYDPHRHPSNTPRYGQDPGVACFAFGAVALQLLNRGTEALAASERALNHARSLNQPTTLALAMHFSAMMHQCRGNAPATEKLAEDCMQLSHKEGFSFWLAGSRILRGWAWAARGGAEAGIAEIRRGIDAWLATGSRTYITYFRGLLAESLLRIHQQSQALTELDQALHEAQTLPEHLYDNHLIHLRQCCDKRKSITPTSPKTRKGRGGIRTHG